MIFVTGDIHGENDIRKLSTSNFPQGRGLTKSDYVICTGDFGLVWDVNQSRETEANWLKWLTEKPWTTLFVDGNHENFDRLFALPEAKMFGGKVGVLNDSIYHLKRGEVYTIDENKVFVFGGAQSVDRVYRTEYISWWRQEMPSYAEMQQGIDNLRANQWAVDYVLTHTCPKRIGSLIPEIQIERMRDSMAEYLDTILDSIQFKMWYFSHMHIDRNLTDKFVAQYQSIVKIGEHISARDQDHPQLPARMA
jgi:hypothetical protein